MSGSGDRRSFLERKRKPFPGQMNVSVFVYIKVLPRYNKRVDCDVERKRNETRAKGRDPTCDLLTPHNDNSQPLHLSHSLSDRYSKEIAIMWSSYINLTTVTISTVVLSTIFALTTIGPATILKRLRKTKYNYEVTLALYMLTPTERFIFSMSILLFLLSSSRDHLFPLPFHSGCKPLLQSPRN